MNDPYENQYIGAFIYSLGYMTALKSPSKSLSSAVNLLQQTPADKTYGDLIFQNCSVGFLVEFKRDFKSLSTEFKKSSKTEFQKKLSRDSDLAECSKRCHFLAWGTKYEKGDATLGFRSYCGQLLGQSDEKPIGLEGFIDRVLASDVGLKADAFRKYLQAIASSKCGGLIVSICEEGKVHMLNVDDLSTIDIDPPMIKPNLPGPDIDFS